jgi:hypothetical protein
LQIGKCHKNISGSSCFRKGKAKKYNRSGIADLLSYTGNSVGAKNLTLQSGILHNGIKFDVKSHVLIQKRGAMKLALHASELSVPPEYELYYMHNDVVIYTIKARLAINTAFDIYEGGEIIGSVEGKIGWPREFDIYKEGMRIGTMEHELIVPQYSSDFGWRVYGLFNSIKVEKDAELIALAKRKYKEVGLYEFSVENKEDVFYVTAALLVFLSEHIIKNSMMHGILNTLF